MSPEPEQDPPASAVSAALALDAAVRAYGRWAQAWCRERGTTVQRVAMLAYLHQDGAQSMTDLADALGISARASTSLANALEEQGMLVRTASAHDGRRLRVELTAIGRVEARAIDHDYRRASAARLRTLPDPASPEEVLGGIRAAFEGASARGRAQPTRSSSSSSASGASTASSAM